MGNSNKYVNSPQDITLPPTQSCKVVVFDDEGNVSSGTYSPTDGYNIRDKSIVPKFWLLNDINKDSIITSSDNLKAVQIVDPVTEEILCQISGFNMLMSYNMEVMKTEDDILKMAEGLAQFFMKDCIDTLLEANNIEK